MSNPHERKFVYPHVTEKVVPKATLTPDTFLDRLELNLKALYWQPIGDLAISLAEYVPPVVEALQPPQATVYQLDDYRHGNSPEAA